MASKRCEICGWAFAKRELNGLCTPCNNKRYEYDNEGEKSAYDDYGGYASNRPFFPKNFGIIRETFPIIDKGKK